MKGWRQAGLGGFWATFNSKQGRLAPKNQRATERFWDDFQVQWFNQILSWAIHGSPFGTPIATKASLEPPGCLVAWSDQLQRLENVRLQGWHEDNHGSGPQPLVTTRHQRIVENQSPVLSTVDWTISGSFGLQVRMNNWEYHDIPWFIGS